MTMTQIDPDNNFYENAKIDCQFYTDDKLNASVKYENGFYIVHFNCRSLPVNFKRVTKESLTEIKNNVDIVALTETWLNEIDKEDYVINGYENIDECIETVINIFRNISRSKTWYFCGDLYINLLNHDKHRKTREFVDALFSIHLLIDPFGLQYVLNILQPIPRLNGAKII